MSQWFTDAFRAEYDKQSDEIGRFNLAVFGKTGVGKSTLINAVFGEPVAATGIGEPVTKDSHLYLDRRGRLGIVDTRGLEIGRDDKALAADLSKFVKEYRRKPINEQVHAAWYCVRPMDRRFEESEAQFIRNLVDHGLGVILVFTQVPSRDGVVHPDVIELARRIEQLRLPIFGERPVFTNAMRDPFTGQPAFGLIDLVQATFRIVPEAAHAALVAEQQVDLASKARESHKTIGAAAAGAAAAAATPIPFSDAAVLVPIQLAMMGRLAIIHKLRFDRAAMLAVASTAAATTGGRAAVTGLLKFIPGAGTIAGGAIGAGVASTFTFAMGQAWLVVCQRAASGNLPMIGGVVDSDAVREVFLGELGKRMPKIRRE
ncbi:GTPase family protein [Naumannella huperziae]